MNFLKNFLSWTNMNKASNLINARNVRQMCTSGKLINVQENRGTGFSVVAMQRPPVNAMNYELISELLSTFINLEKSKSRGMILTSNSGSVFSAGLDVMEMCKPQQERLKKFWTALQDMWLQLFSSSYPTVAVLNGHSPAGGCLMACSCEYRIMVEGKFTIGLNETQLGIVAPSWFMDTYKLLIPTRVAELALTQGKLFTAEEALKIGLIDEIAPDKESAMKKAEEFLNRFQKISYTARANTKLAFRYEAIKRLQDGREQDLKTFLNFVNMPEVQKGLDMYMQELKKRGKN